MYGVGMALSMGVWRIALYVHVVSVHVVYVHVVSVACSVPELGLALDSLLVVRAAYDALLRDQSFALLDLLASALSSSSSPTAERPDSAQSNSGSPTNQIGGATVSSSPPKKRALK